MMPAKTKRSAVKICDVTLRDGMQTVNREARLPLGRRAELAGLLQRAGLPYLEVGSFVHPHVVPAMRDSAELAGLLEPSSGIQFAALVPNARYYARMAEVDNLDTVAVFASASESYSELNLHKTVDQGVAAACEVARLAIQDGRRVRAYLSYAFRHKNPAHGIDMPVDRVRVLSEQFLEAGCYEIAVSDTDGKATPLEVEDLLAHLAETIGLEAIAVHLHDRYGAGLANALLAYQAGVRIFDCTLGGVGGNVLLEDAVGNIATEELVHLFDGLGVPTGIDFEALLAAGRLLLEILSDLGEPAPPSKIFAHPDS